MTTMADSTNRLTTSSMNNAKTTEIIRILQQGTFKLLELEGLNATILFRTFYRKWS